MRRGLQPPLSRMRRLLRPGLRGAAEQPAQPLQPEQPHTRPASRLPAAEVRHVPGDASRVRVRQGVVQGTRQGRRVDDHRGRTASPRCDQTRRARSDPPRAQEQLGCHQGTVHRTGARVLREESCGRRRHRGRSLMGSGTPPSAGPGRRGHGAPVHRSSGDMVAVLWMCLPASRKRSRQSSLKSTFSDERTQHRSLRPLKQAKAEVLRS